MGISWGLELKCLLTADLYLECPGIAFALPDELGGL